MHLDLLHYDQLTKDQLYRLFQLRADVFVLEQQSLYRDIDGQDLWAWHVLAYEGDELIGCVRILRDMKDHSAYSIGRVVVAPSARKQGLGKAMMERALEFIGKEEGAESVSLSAQQEQVPFYQALGFVVVSEEPYDDGGIPHLDMIRSAKNA